MFTIEYKPMLFSGNLYSRITISVGIDLNDEISLNLYDDLKYIQTLSSFAIIRNKSLLLINHTYNITFTTYPDTGYLALQNAVYSLKMPDYILYINSSNVNYMPNNAWIESSINNLCVNDSDILFGGSTIFQNKTVGIGVAIIKASLVREILYYTNSTYSSTPPLLLFSLMPNNQIHILYNIFEGMKPLQNYNYIHKIENLIHQHCAHIKKEKNYTLATILPLFLRQNIYEYIKIYEKELYKTNYYVIVQCENRFNLNLEQLKININYRVPIYHIWCYNWKPLFMFPVYISGMLPADFIMRYDDDQYPIGIQTQKILSNFLDKDDVIIGLHSYEDTRIKWNTSIFIPFCGKPDHVASPMMYRPINAKISARVQAITFAHGEDMYLSMSSHVLCGTKLISKSLKFKMFGNDGLNHESDPQMKKAKGHQKSSHFMYQIYNHFRRDALYIPACFRKDKAASRGNFSLIEFKHTNFFE